MLDTDRSNYTTQLTLSLFLAFLFRKKRHYTLLPLIILTNFVTMISTSVGEIHVDYMTSIFF